MKDFNETFFKLMIVYEHFSSLELHNDYSSWKQEIILADKKQIEYQAVPFVYKEVSSLFPLEWVKITDDLIFYRPDAGLEENESMQHFLGLSEQEFCHLFIPNFQIVKQYGGQELSLQSGPKEVANNIQMLLEIEIKNRK